MSKVGRKPVPVFYKHISYEDKQYCIGTITSKNGVLRFIIDENDFDMVKSRSWHISSTGYVVSYYNNEVTTVKQLLLHNLIMNRLTFPGRGAKESVDHINRNPLDNRKENLRIVTQTQQNINQGKKPRNIVKLPENCGIIPEDIPRHVWYIKANGAHGDRFGIDLKTENIKWKSSSSKTLSLQDKLTQAKTKLQELYQQYPYLNPENEDIVKNVDELNRSFNEITSLAT